MDRLIGEVLGLARGLQVQAAEDLVLAPWLQERLQTQAEWAASRGATLDVQCPDGLRAWVDVAALQRVVDNFLANAVHHAAGRITLQAAPGSSSDRVRIAVLDRGPGIPADQLEAVFAPFTRLDAARTPGQGSGLGLAIARQLAQQHGWAIGLQRREGGGLIAWVEIPMAPVDSV